MDEPADFGLPQTILIGLNPFFGGVFVVVSVVVFDVNSDTAVVYSFFGKLFNVLLISTC